MAPPCGAPRPGSGAGSRRATSGAEQLGDAEGQVERLAAVEPGVAGGGVALVELALDDVLDPTEALGDVVAGQLDVDAAGPGPLDRWVRKNPWSSPMMSSNRRVFWPPSAVNVLPCIGIADPHHRVALVPDGPQERRAGASSMASTPNRVIRVRRPGTRSGLSRSHSPSTSSAVADGPILEPIGLWMPDRNSTVGAVELAGALAHPQHVGRAVVPVVGQRVAAGQRLLVVEDERLVAGPEVDLVEGVLVE